MNLFETQHLFSAVQLYRWGAPEAEILASFPNLAWADIRLAINRYDALTFFQATICPYCSSTHFKEATYEQILLGVGKDPESDPNHHKLHCVCALCEGFFVKHWRRQNRALWYTDANNKLLAGKPGCCETAYQEN